MSHCMESSSVVARASCLPAVSSAVALAESEASAKEGIVESVSHSRLFAFIRGHPPEKLKNSCLERSLLRMKTANASIGRISLKQSVHP